ncbi:hypothetical protein TNCV_4368101 [Trichonephila clavipes]|nr:hypothetical protein TNCV_4368101 [Trichonephila clavipes]
MSLDVFDEHQLLYTKRSLVAPGVELMIRQKKTMYNLSSKAEFTPRLSASSVKRLANQRLHLGRNEVSDWLDARHSTFVRPGVNES